MKIKLNLFNKLDTIGSELIDYFDDVGNKKRFNELMCLPHLHHHLKSLPKTPSGSNLAITESFNPKENVNSALALVISQLSMTTQSIFLDNKIGSKTSMSDQVSDFPKENQTDFKVTVLFLFLK